MNLIHGLIQTFHFTHNGHEVITNSTKTQPNFPCHDGETADRLEIC